MSDDNPKGATRELPEYVFEDARRLANEVEMLRRLGVLINRLEIEEDSLFHEMVTVVRANFRADQVRLLLPDPERDILHVVDGDHIGTSDSPRVVEMKSERSPFADVIRKRRSVLVPNRADLPSESPLANMMRTEGMKSLVSVPLRASRETIGALNLASRSTLTYQPGNLPTLELLGTLFGSVVANVRLFERVAAARREAVAILDQFDEPIAVIDRERRVVRLNRALKDAVNAPYTDILMRPWTEILEHVAPEVAAASIDSAFESAHEVIHEIHPELGGTLEVIVSPLEVVDGRVKTVVHRTRDVTEERAERARSAGFRTAVEHMRDGAIFVGSQGSILDANPAAAKVLGVSKRDLLEQELPELLTGLGVEESVLKRLAQEEALSEGISGTLRVTSSAETWIDYEIHPLEFEDGGPSGLMVFVRHAAL